MKRLLFTLLVLALMGTPAGARAEDAAVPGTLLAGQETAGGDKEVSGEAVPEGAEQEGAAAEQPQTKYLLEPYIRTWLGLRFFDVEGSRTRAAEYEWPYSTVTFGGMLHFDPLPHRLDAELDWKDPYDIQAELAYAYMDVLKFNFIGWSLWHNLNHFVPQPFSMLDDRDPAAAYHVTAEDDRMFLRLKWPERAYHLFVDFRQYEKEGTVQARFREGSNIVENGRQLNTKGSRSREIDWITRRYNIGMNGHFGPVEVEYSHMLKTFEPHKDVVLKDTINNTPNIVHSAVPELQTNSDTIKAHTDLTGRIVAAATFTTGEKQNFYSKSEVDFHRFYGDFTAMPLTGVTVAVRYRFNQLIEAVPASIGTNVAGTQPGIPIDPIDRRENRAEVTVRYRLSNQLGIKAEYIFDNVKRYNVSGWNDLNPEIVPFQDIPNVQNIHTVRLGINSRPIRSLDFRGSVEYAYTEDPAYPTSPKNHYKGRFDGAWNPSTVVNVDAHYRFTADSNGFSGMSNRYDNPGALVVWTPAARVFLAAGYDYFRNRNDRDIELTRGVAAPDIALPVDRVPYRDAAHVYSLSGGYSFSFPLSLEVEYHQSFSKGSFRTVTTDGVVSAAGLGELTDLSIRETGGSVTAKYAFPKGWGTSMTYRISDFQDLKDKPQDGPQDGTAHTLLVMLTRKW
jgi:hypothetical protein